MKKSQETLEALRNKQKLTCQIYKPQFFRLNNLSEHENFTKLLSLPGITLVDYIYDQIKELVKSKNSETKFSTEALELKTNNYIGDKNLDEFGVWVYYPWSNRLVHILDEEDFISVRTSRNQYKITPEERDLLSKKKIGVIGLSVGQSVSVTLAMERICGELRLADFDLLELTNLNRIRTGVHNLGLAKVYSVAREIAEIDPFIKVKCFPEGLTEQNMDDFFTTDGKLDLLVEESDGFDIKILSRYKARELRVPVIMEASDRCMVDVERFDLEPDRAILHGIVKHLDIDTLKSLKTNEEKIPYMLDVLGLETTSPRLRASMLEMQQTISTWPQLASAVTMGGGITADVSRRMLLNQFTDSGRYYVDIDQLIGNKKPEATTHSDSLNQATQELSLEKMKAISETVNENVSSEIKAEDLVLIIEAASLAPSHANKQPWKWFSKNNRLFLFHNKETSNNINDYENINSNISLGAAIENVLIKSSALGYKIEYKLFPNPSEKDLIALFNFKTASPLDPGSLSNYISKRSVNRKLGTNKEIPAKQLEELISLSSGMEGASLSFITDKEKIEKIAELVGICDRIRLLNPDFHFDYFKNEIRLENTDGSMITKGIDVKTLEMPPPVETAFQVISDPNVANLLNKWEKGKAFEKMTRQIVSSSSAIGLISMPSGRNIDFINGGRLAEKIWLTTTKNNLAFQPICLPLYFLKGLGNWHKSEVFSDKVFSEIEAIRAQLSLIFNELNSREGIFLFRLFEADLPLTRSLRKPLNEIYFKS